MKKIILLFSFFLVFAGISMAQTAPAKKEAPKKEVKKEAPKKEVKKEAPAPPKQDAQAQGPMKKDGTPDKRYKANKAAPAEGPKKKDGTPDMRYKENKKKG